MLLCVGRVVKLWPVQRSDTSKKEAHSAAAAAAAAASASVYNLTRGAFFVYSGYFSPRPKWSWWILVDTNVGDKLLGENLDVSLLLRHTVHETHVCA